MALFFMAINGLYKAYSEKNIEYFLFLISIAFILPGFLIKDSEKKEDKLMSFYCYILIIIGLLIFLSIGLEYALSKTGLFIFAKIYLLIEFIMAFSISGIIINLFYRTKKLLVDIKLEIF